MRFTRRLQPYGAAADKKNRSLVRALGQARRERDNYKQQRDGLRDKFIEVVNGIAEEGTASQRARAADIIATIREKFSD